MVKEGPRGRSETDLVGVDRATLVFPSIPILGRDPYCVVGLDYSPDQVIHFCCGAILSLGSSGDAEKKLRLWLKHRPQGLIKKVPNR